MLGYDRFTFIVIFVVLLDQISKYYSKTFVENTGAVFGLLSGFNWLFILISFLVVALIVYYKGQIKGYGLIGLGFLMGGVIGNLIDRIVYGFVKDFIRFGPWPAFNIADVANVVGVVILIFYFLKK